MKAPRGMRDVLGDAVRQHRWLVSELDRVTTLYGYKWIDTPCVEQRRLYTRGAAVDESSSLAKEMYGVVARSDRGLVLRPEATSGV